MKYNTERNTPEFRQTRAELFNKMTDRLGSQIDLDTHESRETFFRNLGPNGFIDGLEMMNRILAKNHRMDDYFASQPNVINDPADPNEFHFLPLADNKHQLLRSIYEVTKASLDKPNGSIEHAAAVIGMGINAIHPFEDCNGRTARAAYSLFTADPDERSEAIRRASLDTSENGHHLNPSFFRDAIYSTIQSSLGSHYEKNGTQHPYLRAAGANGVNYLAIKPENREYNIVDPQIMQGTLSDHNLAETLPFYFVQNSRSEATAQSMQTYGNGTIFRTDIFMSKATREDMQLYKDCFSDISKFYIDRLLDMIADPRDAGYMITAVTKERGEVTMANVDFITQLAQRKLTLVDLD